MNKLAIICDPKHSSMYRHPNHRVDKPADPRWNLPRFLERVEKEIPTVTITAPHNPPPGSKVVWFALPDPQPVEIERGYEVWNRVAKCPHVINIPSLTYMTKQLWFHFLNSRGIRAPMPNHMSIFKKTEHHGHGPEFGCEYIESRGANPVDNVAIPNTSRFYKVWRMVVFNGKCADMCARLEGRDFWVGTGCAQHFKDMWKTPPQYKAICEKVAQVSGLGYFHIEIIPSPWVGPVVCDVCPHPFDVMECRLNDAIQEYTIATIKEWLK
jgi:hypothetical protein